MKEYLAKKYVFTVFFLIVIYALAILNFIYAFDELKKNIKDNITNADVSNIEGIINTTDKFIQGLDTTMNSNVKDKYNYIELFGLYTKILGKNEYNGYDIVKDHNGVLLYGNLWNFNLSETIPTMEYAKRVYTMQQKQKDTNTSVYVISMPVKSIPEYLKYDDGVPYQDYSDVADNYLYYCKQYNINTIDMRIGMKQSGLSYDEMFFKTDHHWTPLAGFYGFKYLIEQLKLNGYDLDKNGFYTDIENYNIETFNDCWLGTFAVNTGVNYIDDMESITILTPKYETKFNYIYRYAGDDNSIEVSGPMDGTLIQRKHIYMQMENDIYNGSAYSTYMNGICAYDHIENVNNQTGPKVLFIRDSYTSVVAPFFANVCSEIDLVWAKEYEYGIEKLIEENQYDLIFVATWPENLGEDSFDFYKEN